jgi:hypothetical protein
MAFLENNLARLWNNWCSRDQSIPQGPGLRIGNRVINGAVAPEAVVLADGLRTQHAVVLGRTGTGKSSLICGQFIRQDIASDTGFIQFDFHGDSSRYTLRLIAAEESRRREDLSGRLIVIEPADPEWAVGLNILGTHHGGTVFVAVAEFAEILKKRWHMESFGARTEELLRNALHVLSDNRLTLVELAPLLTNSAFRASCLERVNNADVAAYFRERYDSASDGMQAVLREPVLNKVSTFTADPRFRHILGQRVSRFSLIEAIDQGYWIVLNLDKARLGEQALTLASLFLAQVKNALFARRLRRTFCLYLDEVQNLVASDAGLETLLSESRKFGVQVCTANQFWDQMPTSMRAALQACGSHVFFRLSGPDAEKVAAMLDGGKPLQELLKNLPQRQVITKLGPDRFRHAVVPEVSEPRIDPTELYLRSRSRWAVRRADIERDIRQRIEGTAVTGRREDLHDWE